MKSSPEKTGQPSPAPVRLFLDALAGANRAGRPPVWLMRQAGRYLPEYRAIRERYSFKEMCLDVDVAVEVSLLPHRIFDVDAIIVFNDILIPVEAMGAELVYSDEGPVFTAPVRDAAAVGRLRELDPGRDTVAILEAISRLRDAVGDRKPVLGFAGAPFTLASYLVDGRVGAKGVETLMRYLYQKPDFVHRILDLLAEMTVRYLRAQIEAGASAVQLFDTWAGQLGPREYLEFVQPRHRRIFEALAPLGAPTILFVKGGGHLIEAMAASGAAAISLDWRVPLPRAREVVGAGRPLQGNLDPLALFAPVDRVRRLVEEILEDRRGDPAFVFNLGHGVMPGTPVESVRALVETVQGWRDDGGASPADS